ncbi:DMT family transporter [Pelagibius sp.]|uniref:DMT family transporter n=1 Tax=Pelagibius sp. TaxID=1931238 RepID=UPI00260849DE|nr:DMT family transporter [Pelagibius sp.]
MPRDLQIQPVVHAPLQGIALMIAAFTTFAALDTTAKYLVQFYPPEQVVWARYTGHCVLALVILWPRNGAALLRSQRLGTQVLRSLLLFATTCTNFVALQYLQLAETSAIFFSTPLIVALLSVPLLGERIGPRRWTAILIGFLGVLVVVRPGLGLMHWAAGLSLLTALGAALYQITTRKLAGVDPAATTQFYTALVGTLAITPLVPFTWQAPDLTGVLLMALLGALGGFGHWLLILAHRMAPAPILAPFNYTQIAPMVLLGFLVFGDLPDVWTVTGAGVVLMSGLYLLYRERKVKAAARS